MLYVRVGVRVGVRVVVREGVGIRALRGGWMVTSEVELE